MIETLLLKEDIANRERLVNNQHISPHMCLYGEGQPYNHTARVHLHRLLDKLADIRERGDLVEALLHLSAAEAQYRAVKKHILAPGELGVEAAAQLQQGGDAAIDGCLAFGGRQRPGDDLQQRALAAAVTP